MTRCRCQWQQQQLLPNVICLFWNEDLLTWTIIITNFNLMILYGCVLFFLNFIEYTIDIDDEYDSFSSTLSLSLSLKKTNTHNAQNHVYVLFSIYFHFVIWHRNFNIVNDKRKSSDERISHFILTLLAYHAMPWYWLFQSYEETRI